MTKINIKADVLASLEVILAGQKTPLSTTELIHLLADTPEEKRMISKILIDGTDTAFKRFTTRAEPEEGTSGYLKGKTIRRILWSAPRADCPHCKGTGLS